MPINAYQFLRCCMKQNDFVFLVGVAPRNRKERDLLKILEKYSVRADES